MKTGDHIELMVKELDGTRHPVTKELLLRDGKIFAVTAPRVTSGWPRELQLSAERIQQSPMPSGPPGLFFYQDDLQKPG